MGEGSLALGESFGVDDDFGERLFVSLEGIRETEKGPVDIEIMFHGTISRFDFFEEVEKGLGVISGVDEIHIEGCARGVSDIWGSILSV